MLQIAIGSTRLCVKSKSWVYKNWCSNVNYKRKLTKLKKPLNLQPFPLAEMAFLFSKRGCRFYDEEGS